MNWGLTAQSQTHVNGKASGKGPLCTFSVENKRRFNRHTGTQIQWKQRRRCTWPATETPHWRPERARRRPVPPLILWSSMRMQYWWAKVFLSPDSEGRRKRKKRNSESLSIYSKEADITWMKQETRRTTVRKEPDDQSCHPRQVSGTDQVHLQRNKIRRLHIWVVTVNFKLITFENGETRTQRNSIISTFPCQMDLHRSWAI